MTSKTDSAVRNTYVSVRDRAVPPLKTLAAVTLLAAAGVALVIAGYQLMATLMASVGPSSGLSAYAIGGVAAAAGFVVASLGPLAVEFGIAWGLFRDRDVGPGIPRRHWIWARAGTGLFTVILALHWFAPGVATGLPAPVPAAVETLPASMRGDFPAFLLFAGSAFAFCWPGLTGMDTDRSESAEVPERAAIGGSTGGETSASRTGSPDTSGEPSGSGASPEPEADATDDRHSNGESVDQMADDYTASSSGALRDVSDQLEYDSWEASIDVDFGDVGGMEDVKETLRREVIGPLTGDRDRYEAFGIDTPNILFHGPPGTGKTFMGKALIGELDAPHIVTSGGDITSRWINESSTRVGNLFDDAELLAERAGLAVIFIDEIDAVLPDRASKSSSHQEDTKVVDEFLRHLSECSDRDILVVGATNYLEQLDDAATRAGRFGRKIEYPMPDADTRGAILRAQLAERPRGDITEKDIDRVARNLEGWSAADIESLVKRAALNAVERDADGICLLDIEQARAALDS